MDRQSKAEATLAEVRRYAEYVDILDADDYARGWMDALDHVLRIIEEGGF